MSEGYGWAISETGSPLAGMAHGNSGFLMAYANLYSVSANRKYLDKIRLLLEYEDSLFVPEVGNWMDLRCGDKPGYMNAWCHGAPGILLSRLQLLNLNPDRYLYGRMNIYQFVYYDEILKECGHVFNLELNHKYRTQEQMRRLLKY